MENPPAPSILDSLRTVEFRMNLRGYSVDEVDEYLEKVAIEAESVMEQLRGAGDRLTMANDRISRLEAELHRAGERPAPEPQTASAPAASAPAASAPAAPPAPPAPPAPARPDGVSEETLQKTLLMAQKFVEQTKRETEAEAADILKRAEERARGMVAQAEERARQMAGETEQRLREEVSRLEGAKARLSSDIEAMSRHLDEERTRIRSSLSEALRWLDEAIAPPAPPAPRTEPAATSGPTDQTRPPADPPVGAQRPEAVAAGAKVTERPVAQSAPRLRSVPGGAAVEALFDQARHQD